MKRTRVLLLGDSISLGYRSNVKNELKDFCKVVYPIEQGKYASDIYRMLFEWKNDFSDEEIGFIYWNAGLWDVVRIYGEEPQSDEYIYRGYLKKTVLRMKKIFPKAKICFALTTPVIEERYDDDFIRFNNDIVRYNQLAKEELEVLVDCIDDLYGVVEKFEPSDYIDATHLGFEANKKVAKHIELVIRKRLQESELNYKKVNSGYFMNNSLKLQNLKLDHKENVVCWGVGNVFDECFEAIQKVCKVVKVVDRDKSLWGSYIKGVLCISPDDIKEDICVVVTLDNVDIQDDIKEWCLEKKICCFTYQEFLDEAWPLYEKRRLSMEPDLVDVDPLGIYEMSRYVGIDIPENFCNFDCSYCYLSLDPNRRGKNHLRRNPHNPRFIRWSLSRKRLGGTCLIGITASGETMFSDNLNQICLELLKEGHSLHIVTNGSYYEGIEQLVRMSGEYARHIIFKLSFHYLELKKRNLLKRFVDVVNFIENSRASYTIEMMPCDELVPYIEEIKNFTQKEFGNFPQLTIGRDEGRGARLLSQYSFSEYMDIWSVFDSEMLRVRKSLYMLKGRYCEAGPLSFFINLYTGTVRHCLYHENVGNIYLDEMEKIDLKSVGNTCPMNYCFNCHVYATLGVLPLRDVPTYYEIRDRVGKNGSHWIKEDMRRTLDRKLCDYNC